MIDPSIRLQRAIYLNDLLLVKRIIKNNPEFLQNPDFADKSNTSLHLASKLGYLDIVTFLIDAGHEDEGISRNADWDTPLTLAAEAHPDVVELLIQRFERCVTWTNKEGVDALMLASRAGLTPIITTLLSHRVSITAADNDGNTALHYASAYGQLKAIRTLLYAGASPLARNVYSWTPMSYSSTVAAEVYFKNLVSDFEKRRVESMREERAKRGAGGVRLVTDEEGLMWPGEESGSGSGSGRGQENRGESPVMMRRAQTPTAGRSEGWGFAGLRARASSGD
ncbi:MAG: hypothetical protein M1830_007199 [Pleopsidium flavum]|nr:MAG: hypothetical protein M1830_007199 [Pleopsidium flavum]